jgi:hypothetical protein
MKRINFKKIALFTIFAVFAGYVAIKLRHIENRLHNVTRTAKHFDIDNLVCRFKHDPQWDVKVSDDTLTYVNTIMSQPYHWLAKGYQAFAFVSQDGEYVIKFIQQQRFQKNGFKTHPFQYMFNKEFRERLAQQQVHRKEIFNSAKLMFEEMREETGMIYVHLNRTSNMLRKVRLFDALGQTHRFITDNSSFVIQRKARYIQPTIRELMEKGQVDQAKARIDQIFDLVLTLAKKNFVDSDYALIRNNNIGFLKDRAIYIDTGHITKKQVPDLHKQMEFEFKSRLYPLRDWLKITFPQLADYYDSRRVEILASLAQNKTTEHVAQTQEKVRAASPAVQ